MLRSKFPGPAKLDDHVWEGEYLKASRRLNPDGNARIDLEIAAAFEEAFQRYQTGAMPNLNQLTDIEMAAFRGVERSMKGFFYNITRLRTP